MADKKCTEILKQGVDVWNNWRQSEPFYKPDLKGINLEKANLMGANLNEANLMGANLQGAQLQWTNLSNANLSGFETKLNKVCLMNTDISRADLSGADLREAQINDARAWYANFNGAKLQNSNLWGTDFREAQFIDTDLSGANLRCANLVKTNFEGAVLNGCKVHGVSAWSMKINNETKQLDLIITHANEPEVLADDIEVAQFLHLILNNQKIRTAIDTIGKKAVLILGRFTPERKEVLDALKKELRNNKYLPILFDFEKVTSRDLTETIKTLAGLSLFVIADITSPKSSPLELQATVPDYQIPFVPIIQDNEEPFSMFIDLNGKYDWILDPISYKSIDSLKAVFKTLILDRAIQKHKEIQLKKNRKSDILSAEDYINKSISL